MTGVRFDRFAWKDGDLRRMMTPLAVRQFLLGLDLLEEKLRAGEYGPAVNAVVGELQALVEDEDVVAALLADGDSVLAERFDAVLQAGKELRGERGPPHRRCRDCPGAVHTADRCPFRWSR